MYTLYIYILYNNYIYICVVCIDGFPVESLDTGRTIIGIKLYYYYFLILLILLYNHHYYRSDDCGVPFSWTRTGEPVICCRPYRYSVNNKYTVILFYYYYVMRFFIYLSVTTHIFPYYSPFKLNHYIYNIYLYYIL